MSSAPVVLMAYPRKEEELRDEARVLAWLETLAAQGYYLTEQDEPFYAQWEEVLRARSLSAGLSPLARTSARAFCAGERDTLGCTAYSLTEDFMVGVDLWPPEGFVSLSADDAYFTFKETGQHKYELFLRLVEVTYQVWHPLYGFLMGAAADVPYATPGDAQALRVPWLYDVNLFGPEFVRQLGRERLLSAPAWKVKALDDGGALLVPAPYVEADWRRPSHYTRSAVAEHLGIPYQTPDPGKMR